MKRAQPKAYSHEFRAEAMRQLQAGTKPIRQLAAELGVHINMTIEKTSAVIQGGACVSPD